ncbi:pyridoxal phosphate-dependent aminotransferase [Kitasatospora phosalacinea]|uniref:Aminotransferase n=1 Tax=Kitasatospora phosalacinea TaxID=2065 RepID=A0ABW6GL48_9ACTN
MTTAVRWQSRGSAFTIAAAADRLERAGRSVVRLELGVPDLPPPPEAQEALAAALGRPSAYTPPAGLPEVREHVAAHYSGVLGRPVAADEVLLVPGSNLVLHGVLLATVRPGDEVLLPDPGFPPYAELVRLAGAVPVGYPLRAERGHAPDPAEVAALVSPRTRLLVLNTPNNPTGAVTPGATVAALAALARRGGFRLLLDDAYRELVYDGSPPAAAALAPDDPVVLMDSLSKSHSLCGWRVGIAVADRRLVDDLAQLMTNLHCCMPDVVQRAVPAALRAHHRVRALAAELRTRRDLVTGRLSDMPGLRLHPPGGAFYAFPDITATGLTDEQFADRLLHRAGVAVVPGSLYGRHGRGHVRIAFTRPSDQLTAGMDRLHDFLESL